MRTTSPLVGCAVITLAALFSPSVQEQGPTSAETQLMRPGSAVESFQKPTGAWHEVGQVFLDPADASGLSSESGEGTLVNDPPGKTLNLITRDSFGDVEVHLEFMVPKGSNSGIKLMGLYEIQIYDSHGKDHLDGSDNGGIYPKAQLLPRYRHLDHGVAPRVNASKPPGEWQTLDITFHAPRFAPDGKTKTANARFDRVVLNGQVIHEDQDLPHPTGHAWNTRAERPRGPILLQADHGPVAFRNLRVRPLDDAPAPTR